MGARLSLRPPLGEEHDLAPPGEPAAPIRSYAVCSTQRSGSGLLCRALASTGVVGVPTEYFLPAIRRELSERWRCGSALSDYAAALHRHRTTPAGIFGAKLHWDQLRDLRAEALGMAAGGPGFDISAEALLEVFPRPLFVRLVRRDLDRQAVSFWQAFQRATFSLVADADPGRLGRVRYSFAGIRRCREQLALADAHWDRFLRVNDVERMEVEYEPFVHDFEGTVRRVVERILGQPFTDAIRPAASRRMSDEHTEQLLARFLHDLGRRPPRSPLSLSDRARLRLRGRRSV